MSARLPGLSVFLPAHDEEDNIVPAAQAWLRLLPRVARRFELVIVDDGSRDRTGALADGLARRHPGAVRVVRHARNLGYGAALRSGFAAARLDYVFFTDADRQFEPADLATLLPRVDDADVVVGWRRHRADPLHRRLLSRGWNLLASRLVGVQVRDVNCAFKLFRRGVLDGLRLETTGAAASAELLAWLARRGHRVVQVPVGHHPRRTGRASGCRPDVVAQALVELLWLSRRVRSRADADAARGISYAPAVASLAPGGSARSAAGNPAPIRSTKLSP